MAINAKKSAVVSFSRKTDKVTFRYSIGGVAIPRCETQIDLGATFDCGLSFRAHICRIVCECSRHLGAIC